MAIDFNGSASKLDLADALADLDSAAFSCGCWINIDTLPSLDANEIIMLTSKASTTGGVMLFTIRNTSAAMVLRFFYDWVAGTDIEHHTDNSFALNTWHHVLVTYDRGSTANDPIFYVNGSAEASTEVTGPPSGTADSTQDSIRFGANLPGTGAFIDGTLMEAAFWNRILSASEASILAASYSPLFIPNGLKYYWPFIRGLSDRIQAKALVDTSTAVVAHDRMIYPAPTRIIHVPAAAAVGNPWHAYANQ